MRKLEEKAYIKSLISGGIAGAIAGFLTTPCDVIKTRMMTNAVRQYNIKPLQWLLKTIREEGYSALFKGWHVRIIYLGLGGVVWFGCYRVVVKLIGAEEEYKKIRNKT